MIVFVSTSIHEAFIELDKSSLRKMKTPGEILCFQGKIPEFKNTEITFLITGSGESRSLVAFDWLEKNIKPTYLIHIGFSDSTSENATPGHIIISSAIGNLFGYPIDWNLNNITFKENPDEKLSKISKISCLNGNLDFHSGKTISVSNKFRTDRMRKWVNTRKDVLAIDNTGFFSMIYAEKHNIPFLSITSIINYLEEDDSNFMKNLDYSPTEEFLNHLKFFNKIIYKLNFKKRIEIARSNLKKFIELFGDQISIQNNK